MSAAGPALPHLRALSRFAFAGAAAVGTVLLALPASAHVTVSPGSAQPGSAAVLTFHVPNEEANADVNQVDLQIPTDHPIAQLLVQPVPGWMISVRTATLAKALVTDDGKFSQAVSEVIWSGGKVAPGQFQDFTVSADPLPAGISQLTFKTIQTYSNGDVVRWIDVSQPGQAEPEHPAAVLTLSAGSAAGSDSAAVKPAAVPPSSSTEMRPAGSDAVARGAAFGALACGLGALALGWLNRRRRTVLAPAPAPAPAPVPAPIPTRAPKLPPAGATPARAGSRRGTARR